MKNDSKASQAGAETNDWVDQITGSADYEGAVLFFGYAGRSAADPENSISLYLDAALGKKLDIRKEDILFSQKTTDSNNLEAMLVWTKKSIQHATEAEASPASFLQGDIYNAYLNQNAIPTIPVVSCITCTGIPAVCAQAPQSAANTGSQAQLQTNIPSMPGFSCVVCPTTPPAGCFSAQGSGLQANAQGAIPTLPIEACVPTMPVISCVTCTGLSFVCAQAPQAAVQGNLQTVLPTITLCSQNPAAQTNAAIDIPTVPVVSCVTCTGIPFVCSQAPNAAQQGNLQTVFPTITLCSKAPQAQASVQTYVPTIPVINCATYTGLPFSCTQAANSGGSLQAGAQTGIPTMIASTCFPTLPVMTCYPAPTSVWCPKAAPQSVRANVQGAIPTLPVEACVPTMPVVSCVTCTGIPFVC